MDHKCETYCMVYFCPTYFYTQFASNKYIASIVKITANRVSKIITSKGFELDRGLPVEETGAKHEKIEDIKIIKLNREKVENNKCNFVK